MHTPTITSKCPECGSLLHLTKECYGICSGCSRVYQLDTLGRAAKIITEPLPKSKVAFMVDNT